MAVNIPGLSLSLLRQQTSVQAGLPLLISGRFTAFGMGVPAFIRVFLEGPSYDPKLRSFDTFASPFSGDYTVNVLAEKDGQYNVYAQAFPPLIPTGPLFPEAMMLLPPIAESTRPPLVVGYPFEGGVDALLPDGTRQRLTAPPMQPIEFRPIVTVAPGITVIAPGVPAAYPGIPAYPPAVPPAPPPAVPAVEVITRATIDDIRFSPEEINPGMEATGLMSWRNAGDAPQLFDTVFYLVSPFGVRYGPLQVNQDIAANPQVPATQNLRFSTEGMPSGLYSVVAEIYDSTTGALLATRTLPSRLQIREIAPPVIPTPPPPEIPAAPTQDILGQPSLNLPRQINVGDIWSGSVSMPTFGTVPYFVESHLVMIDPSGYQYTVGQGGRTLSPWETLQVPINYDTAGLPAGNYSLFLMVYDQVGQQVAQFPMGFLSMIAAPAIPPEFPPPGIPPEPEIPPPPLAVPYVINTYGPAWVLEHSEWLAAGFTGNRYEGTYDQWKYAFELAHPGQSFESYVISNIGFDPGYAWWAKWGRYGEIAAPMVPTPELAPPAIPPPEVPAPPMVPTPELAPPAIPPPEVPLEVLPPDFPTVEMFSMPSHNLPSRVKHYDIWSGNISIPTQWPVALPKPTTIRYYSINIDVNLDAIIGGRSVRYKVADYSATFTPGQTINVPVDYMTGPVTPANYKISLTINWGPPEDEVRFVFLIGSLGVIPA